jgi:uncharacterized HAD superfamily protein/hypoxanthine phosphoribosyltransferase
VNFRSFADMYTAVRTNIHRIPLGIDVVVGIPRSGILSAGIIALLRNIAFTDLDGLLQGRVFAAGTQRSKPNFKLDPATWRRILLVDDSIQSGRSMETALRRVKERNSWDVTTCVVFGIESTVAKVDLTLEFCPAPRMFEWNLMHHPWLASACVDIDGVLCIDPTAEENDDGPRYREFLSCAKPLYLPTVPVGALVSSRLEKYRTETEDWLARSGIVYGALHLMDLNRAEDRRRLNKHAQFKADVYNRNPDWRIFIESDPCQAATIAKLTGKAVVCVNGMTATAESRRISFQRRIARRMARFGQQLTLVAPGFIAVGRKGRV